MTGSPNTQPAPAGEVQLAQDRCALPLVRRLAALLDRDPGGIAEGQPLPRGWHVILFNVPTRQADLRPDGAGQLGVVLPELGLPKLMMGGRHVSFTGDIPVGAAVRRETRLAQITHKQGRSGPFALVDIEHSLFVERETAPALIERVSYVLRGEVTGTAPGKSEAGNQGGDRGARGPSRTDAAATGLPAPIARRQLVPDETLLFRYSAITDNPHRIHYDLRYAREVEGYSSLLVNGTLPAMFLLDMFREAVGREPAGFESRNLAPMYCGAELTLSLGLRDDGWAMLAENAAGQPCWQARAW